jgi:hypothetical protein
MIQVAKITEELAIEILGTISIDNIRLFNPVQDINGNYIIDIQMAIDNGIPFEVIEFIPIPDEMNL